MTPDTELSRAIRRAIFASALATTGVGTALAQETPAQPSGGETAEPVETVVVTGSRIVSPNLASISPVTALTSEEIVRTGRSTIEDVINEIFATAISTLERHAPRD